MPAIKRFAEPFNLFGENALISSKDEAEKILKDNSYYFFIAGAIILGTYILIKLRNMNVGTPSEYVIAFSIFYFALGVAIRKLKSRTASILALITFSFVLLSRISENKIGGMTIFVVIFLAAAYRSVRASFYYHKNTN